MKGKLRFTLGKKIVLMLLIMSATLCTTSLLASYRTYSKSTTEFYKWMGRSVGMTLASQVTAEELDRYYTTLEMDDRYYEIQSFILDLMECSEVQYIYIVRPNGVGVTFLFDSDMAPGENGEYYDGGYCSLGTYVDVEGAFEENLEHLLAGERVEPIVQIDSGYGWLMTAMTPIHHNDGTMAGYVMVDISMREIRNEQQRFLLYSGGLLVTLTIAFLILYLVLIRRSLIAPLQNLTSAAQAYEGTGDQSAILSLRLQGDDELCTLAEAFQRLLTEIERNNREQKELAVRKQRLEGELQLANELNVSVLPKALPERAEGYPFQIQGTTHQGEEMACSFYDYFLLDHDRLCLIVGEVPGNGIPEALYTVMAQTAIKSQMQAGLSLVEAMTAANRHLYELSKGLYLNVLVAVLDGGTGQFSCINAGQRDPLLMRSQDRYEWMHTLSYAPLGQNENVVYQVQELDLYQGDCIFFHTQGLDNITDQRHVPFSREQLRRALNESRSADLEHQLQNIDAAGGAYAYRLDEIGGYALLALEYRRRDKMQAHCLLTANAAGAQVLQDFLRGQMESNDIRGHRMASLMVVADELFALCCRRANNGDRFMAECAVPDGEELVVLRLRGAMGGTNPLEQLDSDAAQFAAGFIEKNCDRILTEHEEGVDSVTIVKRLDTAGKERKKREVGNR